jgi:hypothetical protein
MNPIVQKAGIQKKLVFKPYKTCSLVETLGGGPIRWKMNTIGIDTSFKYNMFYFDSQLVCDVFISRMFNRILKARIKKIIAHFNAANSIIIITDNERYLVERL